MSRAARRVTASLALALSLAGCPADDGGAPVDGAPPHGERDADGERGGPPPGRGGPPHGQRGEDDEPRKEREPLEPRAAALEEALQAQFAAVSETSASLLAHPWVTKVQLHDDTPRLEQSEEPGADEVQFLLRGAAVRARRSGLRAARLVEASDAGGTAIELRYGPATLRIVDLTGTEAAKREATRLLAEPEAVGSALFVRAANAAGEGMTPEDAAWAKTMATAQHARWSARFAERSGLRRLRRAALSSTPATVAAAVEASEGYRELRLLHVKHVLLGGVPLPPDAMLTVLAAGPTTGLIVELPSGARMGAFVDGPEGMAASLELTVPKGAPIPEVARRAFTTTVASFRPYAPERRTAAALRTRAAAEADAGEDALPVAQLLLVSALHVGRDPASALALLESMRATGADPAERARLAESLIGWIGAEGPAAEALRAAAK